MEAMAAVDLEMLREVELFSALSSDQVRPFADAAQETTHEVGEALTEEGSHGYRFHLLLEGSASVDRSGREVATVGPGDFVGEIGLLGGGPSTATVRCTALARALTLRREEFWAVLEAEPAIALRILEVVCRRLEHQFRHGARSNLGGDVD
jgi:CRP/FNR family transcriptional regulator, cyclic AMP receptor protein